MNILIWFFFDWFVNLVVVNMKVILDSNYHLGKFLVELLSLRFVVGNHVTYSICIIERRVVYEFPC